MANRELSIILRLQDEASQSLKKFGANLEGLEPVFKKMTVIGTAAFAAMSGVVLKSTNDFALFEEQIQKAGGNIDATAKELEMFRKVAKDVGITTKFSATEAAEALFFLAGGAIDATEATAGLREAAKISATGELALKDAVILAGDAMTRFKIEAEDASRISDVLLYSTTRVQQTMPELDQAFKQVASTASQAGLSFEQTTGILNLFADSGKRGMEGGIALANILRNLTTNVVPEYETAITDLTKKKSGLSDKVKTTEDQLARLDLRMKNATSKTLPGLQLQYSQTQAKLAKYRSELESTPDSISKVNVKMSEKSELLKTLGVNIFDSSGKIRGMTDVLTELADQFQGMTDAERFANAEILFGARAARDWLTVVSQGSEVMKEYIADVENAGGTADEFMRRVDSARAPMEVFSSLFEYLSLTLGEIFLPHVQKLAEALVPLITRFGEFAEAHPNIVLAVTAIILVVAGLTAGLGALGLIILAITPVITAFGVVIGLLSLPILAIIALIGIIVATVIWWVVNWKENMETLKWAFDEVGKKISEIWESIKTAFKTAVDWIVDNTIKPLVEWIEKIISMLERARAGVASIGGKVSSGISAVRGAIPFADGGIVTRPTLGLVGEAGPEAIIPLSKAGTMGTNVTVIVNGDVSGQDLINKVSRALEQNIKYSMRLA